MNVIASSVPMTEGAPSLGERRPRVEREELARQTPAQKFADTAVLMDLAYALGGATHTDEQIAEVRDRWARLVERMGG